jgi:hypothetical protein
VTATENSTTILNFATNIKKTPRKAKKIPKTTAGQTTSKSLKEEKLRLK